MGMTDIRANIHTKASITAFRDSFSGTLETKGDHDWIKVNLFSGFTFDFYLSFLNTGSLTKGNSTLAIRDASGHLVPGMFDDDGGVGQNSFLSFAPVNSGTYFIDVGEHGNNNTGSYTLVALEQNGTTDKQLTDGADGYTGLAGERILGGKGADSITIGAGVDALGEQGNDTIVGNGVDNNISGGHGNDMIGGGPGSDNLFGDAGNDQLFGGDNDDFLYGGAGADILDGGNGIDRITGGGGKDFLTGGGDGDTFVFLSVRESKPGASRDVITDFDESPTGDAIDLSAIDAKTGTVADDEFTLIGTAKFSHHKGELRYKIDVAHNLTLVLGDVNGDGKADIQIELTGQHILDFTDFQL
jgi:Ca2+-binding RTX toxin-like protein